MTRGNQREKAREKNLKAGASQKKRTNMTGNEQQKAKEDAASIMRAKQAAADAKKSGEGQAGGVKKT